jgi:hypothetical protein
MCEKGGPARHVVTFQEAALMRGLLRSTDFAGCMELSWALGAK